MQMSDYIPLIRPFSERDAIQLVNNRFVEALKEWANKPPEQHKYFNVVVDDDMPRGQIQFLNLNGGVTTIKGIAT